MQQRQCELTPESLFCKALQAGDGNVSLYKIMAGECGEASVPPQIVSYAEEFAGLLEGTCSNQGYTHEDGTKYIQVPVIGDIKISLYSKASLSAGATGVTLYKIEYGECGEATIDQEYEKYAEEFAGLTEGNCSAQGYTVVDGTKDM